MLSDVIQKMRGKSLIRQLKLVIEVDGGYHQTKEQLILDNRRTDDIEFQGLKLIRFTNEEVTFNLEEVLTKIKDFMKSNL